MITWDNSLNPCYNTWPFFHQEIGGNRCNQKRSQKINNGNSAHCNAPQNTLPDLECFTHIIFQNCLNLLRSNGIPQLLLNPHHPWLCYLPNFLGIGRGGFNKTASLAYQNRRNNGQQSCHKKKKSSQNT